MQVNPASASQHQSADKIYTDLNSLQSIRQLGKQDKSAALMEVAQQFESMFVNMMLSSMRQAGAAFSEDSLLNSPETQFYQGMYDQQMALSLTGQDANSLGSGGSTDTSGQNKSAGGVGLADVIYRQLMSNYVGESGATELDQSKLFDRRVTSPDFSALRETRADVDRLLESGLEALGLEEPGLKETVEEESSSELITSNNSESSHSAANSLGYSLGNKGQAFASPREFVAALYPHAQKVAEELGVDAKAIVAQAALETGWGKHMIRDDAGQNSFNFFGIKADGRWGGDSVQVTTHEYRNGVMMKENASFRRYDSMEDGLRDYADFLSSAQRYQQAIGNDLTADQYGHALQQAGYATDPEYGNKIARIARSEWLSGDAVSGETESGRPMADPARTDPAAPVQSDRNQE